MIVAGHSLTAMASRMTTGFGTDRLRMRRGATAYSMRGLRWLCFALTVLAVSLLCLASQALLHPTPAMAHAGDSFPAALEGHIDVSGRAAIAPDREPGTLIQSSIHGSSSGLLTAGETSVLPGMTPPLTRITASASGCDHPGAETGQDGAAHHCCHAHLMPTPAPGRVQHGSVQHLSYVVSRNDGLTLHPAPLLRPPRI